MAKQQHRILNVTAILLLITTLLSSSIIVSASAAGQQTRPAEKLRTEAHYIHQGHRPATSILPVKSFNLYHHRGDTADGANEFDRLNKIKERRTMTRAGLHDAVVHATRQSSDIVVMGATSWN